MRACYVIGFLVLASVFCHITTADQITIAVIGKTKNDSFYEQSFKGCQKHAQSQIDLTCIYDGPADYQDIRSQADIVRSIVDRGVDGILVSTTDSAYLVENILRNVKEKNIPVVTYDSDLLPEHSRYRLAYVGTNNFEYGVALGNYAKKFKRSDETEICIQSGHKTTPNLNDRIKGVRFALSGNRNNKKLNGEHGWLEGRRCPLFTMGQRKTALHQLEFILNQKKPPIYLAVAGFAQFSPDYIEKITPYKERVKSQEIVIISADTEQVQLLALEQGLSTVNIGQRPFEMGRMGAQLLYEYIKNKVLPKKEFYYLDFHYCTPDNTLDCIDQ
jgi:ribose transport system substrate-binding protein